MRRGLTKSTKESRSEQSKLKALVVNKRLIRNNWAGSQLRLPQPESSRPTDLLRPWHRVRRRARQRSRLGLKELMVVETAVHPSGDLRCFGTEGWPATLYENNDNDSS